jgi:eukaryotic-like serine/threonine-protein kinase
MAKPAAPGTPPKYTGCCVSSVTPQGELDAHDTDAGLTRLEDVEDDGDIQAGTMVGEYRIEHRIGKGGMGIVFAAVHPLIGKRVAIKVLRNDICNDRVAVERFIDEARVVNQIEHPNIVDIFAFGKLEDGRNYFVMEWLRGESLRTLMDRTRVPISQVCEIVATLVRALSAAHDHGIVHRDLKPDNVFLVDVKGEQTLVKLLDFGVAKLNEKDVRAKRVGHTATGTIVGTPQYLSPEQARGQEVDYRADIYALGGIAFELLTGQTPFVADNVMEMVAKHIMEPAVRPSTLVDVPPELDDLVVATLAKSSADRPPLSQWLAVLERVKHEPLERAERVRPVYNTPAMGMVLSAPQPTPLPVAPVAKKKRWLVASGLALVVLATAGVLLAVGHTSNDERHTMVLPTMPTPTPVQKPAAPIVTPPKPVVEEITPPAATPKPVIHKPHHANGSAGSAAPSATSDDDDLMTPGSIPTPVTP